MENKIKQNQWFAPIFNIYNRRKILISSVKNSLNQKYAGTVLGMTWLLLGPILLLLLYSAIYLVVFRIRPVGMEAEIYVLYIFCGLVPLINFSQGLTQGAGSLFADKGVLLNTVFPPELIPVREAVASTATLVAGMLIILVVALFLGKFSPTWFFVPIVLMMLLIFLIGLTWVLSLINLVFKDVQQFLTYITIMLLIASPIAYTPEMIPRALQILIYFNPLAYFIISLQCLIVLHTLPAPQIIAGMFLFSFGSIVLGSFVFSRSKTVFYDFA